jgi:hypothetical protein
MIGRAIRGLLTAALVVAVYVGLGGGAYGLYRWYESTQSPATATCMDGTTSHSRHRSGTCSWHSGVKRWLPAARGIP